MNRAEPDPMRVEGPVTQSGDVRLAGRIVAGHDVHLHGADVDEPAAQPFLVVDREYLAEQSQKSKRMYVARSPDWADVVHGSDPELRFIERDQTADLCSTIRDELLEPCRHGTDSRLHCLVVLGAPGSGKTTLVRRVAAMLVLRGECVVADFGVNTERVPAEGIDAYLKALVRLTRAGTPVLVVLDDPFFANAGWIDLLHALSRPQYQGIAVVAASPDFLFDRFGHSLFGRRVVGRTIGVARPSIRERRDLALLHDRDPDGSSTSDEDLLVVAMEATAGESFRTIIERIWMTLNGGVPLDSTIEHEKLPWPVFAFAVACYFHRNYVLCPESLLQEFLGATLAETPPSYLAQELQNLVTQEGWNIFSIQMTAAGRTGTTMLIGSTHARVAREAWRHLPLRGLNVEELVLDASVRSPRAAPQLAELILTAESSANANERRLAERVATRWSLAVTEGVLQAQDVSALVRQLRPSRRARLRFRPVLRDCMKAENSQSWLATWQVYHMSDGTLHPQERSHLMTMSLEWTLKVGDLSKGPHEAIEIAARMGDSTRRIVIDRLVAAVRGEVGWRADAVQVAWLLTALPDAEVVALLPGIYQWLDAGHLVGPESDRSSDALAVEALVKHLATTQQLDTEGKEQLLGVVFDWLLVSSEPISAIVLRMLDVVRSGVVSGDPWATVLLTHVLDWLSQYPDPDEDTWTALLRLMGAAPELAGMVEQVIAVTLDWLCGRADSNDGTWVALLALACRVPHAEQIVADTVDWLRGRGDGDEQTRATVLTLVRQEPALAHLAEPTVEEALDWLRGHPVGSEAACVSLVALVAQMGAPDSLVVEVVSLTLDWLCGRPEHHEAAWATLLAAVGQAPKSLGLAELAVPRTVAWLCDRTGDDADTWSALFALVEQRPDLVERVVLDTFDWLRDRPDSDRRVWVALLPLVRSLPAGSGHGERIATETVDRLRARAEGNEDVWVALLTLVQRVPELAGVAGAVALGAFGWLRERPEANEGTWVALLTLVRQMPELPGLAAVIVPGAVDWVRARPERNEGTWVALLTLVRQVRGFAGFAEHVASSAFDWLRERSEHHETVWLILLALVREVPELTGIAEEIALETFEWLRDHAGSNDWTWAGLLALVGQVPAPTVLVELIVPETFDWLRARPESNETAWAALLALVRRVPVPGLSEKVILDTFAWLRGRTESNESTWAGLLAAVRQSPKLSGQADHIARQTFDWLNGRPESNEAAWAALLTLAGRAPGRSRLAEEIAPAAFERLRGRPESNEAAWAALLTLLRRAPELADMTTDVVLTTFDRLRDRPESESNEGPWAALLALVGQVPELAEQIVPATFDWLRLQPDAKKGVLNGLVLALTSTCFADAPGRTAMLGELHRRIQQCFGVESPQSRGTALLVLVDGRSAEVSAAVERELQYVEEHDAPNLSLLFPLAYAIRSTQSPGLSSRLAAWAQDHGERHAGGPPGYLSSVALLPRMLTTPA